MNIIKKKLLLILIIVLFVTSCGKSEKNKSGEFKVIDGKEVFMIGKEQVIDRLVEVDGEKYYITEEGTKLKNGWHEIDNDGNIAYFGAMGQMIKDQYKEIDDKYYVFDANGILEKNGLKIIGEEKYYASKDGELLTNSLVHIDGQDYYFGKDGKEIKIKGWIKNEGNELPQGYYYLDSYGNKITGCWIEDCYLDENGLMATNKWVDGYYVGDDGKYLKNTITPDGKRVGDDGKVIIMTQQQPAAAMNKENYVAATNNLNSNTTARVEEVSEELYIKNTETIKENFEYSWTSSGDNYDVNGCEITIIKPIIAGANAEETEVLNNQITSLINQLIEKLEDEEVLSNVYHAVSSIKIYKPNIKYTDNKVTISFSGEAKYTTDYFKSSKSYPTFTIEYNRKDKVSKLKKEAFSGTEIDISSNDYIYAE